MFFIASGSVAVRTTAGEQTLRTGDLIGEIAMLEQSSRDVSFISTSRARLLRLQREDFLRLERARPEIGRDIGRRGPQTRMRKRRSGNPQRQRRPG